VGAVAALGRVDLVGAQQRVVQPAHDGRDAVGGVEALVGVRRAGEVRVGGDLPAGEVDRVEARPDGLDGLPAGEAAERARGLLAPEQAPEPVCAEPRERVLDREAAAQPQHVLGRVRPLDSLPPLVVLPLVPNPLGRGGVRPVSVHVHRSSPRALDEDFGS
jgi:hypothetical protein